MVKKEAAMGDNQLLSEHMKYLKNHVGDFYDDVDPARVLESISPPFAATLYSQGYDFEASSRGGRGESYRLAQQNPMVRAVGIQQLFSLISPEENLRNLSSQYKILDVLGGDGTLARALAKLVPFTCMPRILTSDLSRGMVEAAQAYGQPSIQQNARYLLLKNTSFDAVILAYGTHHIPVNQRLEVCREALRILKPGGKIAFHDFESASPVARWFSEVVDRFSLTGHNFPHFTKDEIKLYLIEAGFSDVIVQYVYDPFVLYDSSAEQVERRLGEYLLNMYGLVKINDGDDRHPLWKSVYDLACEYFLYNYRTMGLPDSFGKPQIKALLKGDVWFIEMPRIALVGTATKR